MAEAEAVGTVDDEGVDGGHVDAGFDDRGAHEHVILVLGEVEDDLFEDGFVHLTVRDGNTSFGHKFSDTLSRGVDFGDPVVDVKNLAFS